MRMFCKTAAKIVAAFIVATPSAITVADAKPPSKDALPVPRGGKLAKKVDVAIDSFDFWRTTGKSGASLLET